MANSPRMGWSFPSRGADPWYEQFEAFVAGADASSFAAREDRHLILMEGGTISWNSGTSTLSWNGQLRMLAAITGFTWNVDATSLILSEGELVYVTLTRAPSQNVTVTAHVATKAPPTDGAAVLCVRLNNRIYWRNGTQLNSGDSIIGIGGGGGGGGGSPLTVSEKDGTPSVSGVAEIRLSNGTVTDLGGGVVEVETFEPFTLHYVLSGLTHALAVPSDFVDGLKELGFEAAVQSVSITQEIDGSGGSTTAELYKVSTAGAETQITNTGVLTLAAGGGAKARASTSSFVPGTTSLSANDRLGVKFTAVQTNGEDVTISVVLIAQGGSMPPTSGDHREVTQALSATVTGDTFENIGAIYFEAGTVSAVASHVFMGVDNVSDDAELEIRSEAGVVIATIANTGLLADVQPSIDFSIPASGWYSLRLRANTPAPTVATIRGLKFVQSLGNATRVRQALGASVSGTTFQNVGAVWLPAGTLAVPAAVFLGADDPADGAEVELTRETGGTLVATWTRAAGAPAEVTQGAAVTIPADDWYNIRLRALDNGGTVVGLLRGIDWLVTT